MKGISTKRIISIIAGVLSALGLAYVGIAQIWSLPLADQVQQTIGVIVSLLSALLSVFTGQSIANDRKSQ